MKKYVASLILMLLPFSSFAGKNKYRRSQLTQAIPDMYETLEELDEALQRVGANEGIDLMFFLDFTGSNKTMGNCYANHYSKLNAASPYLLYPDASRYKNLHYMDARDDPSRYQNPYERVLTVLSNTLAKYDQDEQYPLYVFGDRATKNHSVESLAPDGGECCGLDQMLTSYFQAVTERKLSSPTSFIAVLEQAMRYVIDSDGGYHIAVIVTDGEITADYQDNLRTIAKASLLPMEIIIVGVGDGPWDQMNEMDDNMTSYKRVVDNVQFVDFTGMTLSQYHASEESVFNQFALQALQEVPSHFKQVKDLGMLNNEDYKTKVFYNMDSKPKKN